MKNKHFFVNSGYLLQYFSLTHLMFEKLIFVILCLETCFTLLTFYQVKETLKGCVNIFNYRMENF